MNKITKGSVVLVERFFGYKPVPEAWGVYRGAGHVASAPTRAVARSMRADRSDRICRIIGSNALNIRIEIV